MKLSILVNLKHLFATMGEEVTDVVPIVCDEWILTPDRGLRCAFVDQFISFLHYH